MWRAEPRWWWSNWAALDAGRVVAGGCQARAAAAEQFTARAGGFRQQSVGHLPTIWCGWSGQVAFEDGAEQFDDLDGLGGEHVVRRPGLIVVCVRSGHWSVAAGLGEVLDQGLDAMA